ncbi:MAG TPA: MoaD family protein [Phycisphaerae bacterium]|nr:MoaD family protein [Phycisphaerae bacterium]
MPTVTVRFFGPARDLAGESSIEMEIAPGETAGGVFAKLGERYPKLHRALASAAGSGPMTRPAVNRTYVPLSHVLKDGDEVAIIPPVSGGAPVPRVQLVREPIDERALIEEMSGSEAGAIASFIGIVRAEEKGGRALRALDYHAYEDMAPAQMKAIREAALEKFDILDAALVHRLGLLGIGEASIVVVVASAHRAAAFDACRWIVEQVKVDVPIWKQDVWGDGTQEWVEPSS